MAVAGGVEGTADGGSEDGTDPSLGSSSTAKGAGANAAVSTRITGGGGSSWNRVSSFGGNGRSARGGVWTIPSLSAGGGNGALAVAGGVEGIAGGGSEDGTDLSLEDSSTARGAGVNALEVPTWGFTAGVSIRLNRYLYVAAGPPSPIDGEAGVAVVGTPARRGSEGVCIRVVNRLSVSAGPPSILGGEFAFLGVVAQPHSDVRRRRTAIIARCTLLIRIIPHIFNDM